MPFFTWHEKHRSLGGAALRVLVDQHVLADEFPVLFRSLDAVDSMDLPDLSLGVAGSLDEIGGQVLVRGGGPRRRKNRRVSQGEIELAN